MKFICPLIVVADIEASRKFYTEHLGLEVKYDFGENVTFDGDFAIHLESHFKSLIDADIQNGGNNHELYFEDDKVDDVAAKLKASGVELVHDVREQPWRQKVLRFYDPDRHIIEIGESMPHLCYRLSLEGKSVKEISQISMMPEPMVEHSIAMYSK